MLDKIRQIKLHRMTPAERFVYEIFTNLVEYYHPEYPNNKYYKYNDDLLFNHNLNNGYFWCHHTKFWRILESEMKLNYNQIQDLVKKMVKEHLKKDVLKSEWGHSVDRKSVENTLIKKEIEPLMGVTEHKIEKELIQQEINPVWMAGTERGLEEELKPTSIPVVSDVSDELIKKEIIPKLETEHYMLLSEKELIKKIHPHTTDNVCAPIQVIQPHGTKNVETYPKITEQLIKK